MSSEDILIAHIMSLEESLVQGGICPAFQGSPTLINQNFLELSIGDKPPKNPQLTWLGQRIRDC